MGTKRNNKPEWFTGTQKQWKDYIQSREKTFFQRTFIHRSYIKDTENIQKIMHFVECVQDGDMTDEATLFWIADCFKKYIDGKALYLDSAFGLRSKPRKGNPAEQFTYDKKMNSLLNTMAEILVENKKITQDRAAEMTLEKVEDSKIDASTLSRYFRDWPARKHAIELYEIKKRINKP